MTTKTNVWPVITDHIDTLVDYQGTREPRVSIRDISIQYALPVAAGSICALAVRGPLVVDGILSGAAILTAFSFGLAVFAFQLRTSTTGVKGSRRLRLLDEFFANVLYSVVVGLTWSLILMLLSAVQVSGAWARAANALLVTLGLHYLIVMLMCIKRLRATYRDATR